MCHSVTHVTWCHSVPHSTPLSDVTPEPDHDSDESELIASEHAYLTIPEALEVAFKASSRDTGPRTYAEAMKLPDAQQHHEAAVKEIQAHIENGTWILTTLPPGRKAIGCRWVFLIKRKSDGSVDRYKARLVAKGYSQRPGIDYNESFAPTFRPATLRIIMAMAAIQDLELRSIDISSAFINGDLEEEIYMKQPEGFIIDSPHKVCRLKKSLYGLKQAARQWNIKLHTVLTEMGFKRIESDRSHLQWSPVS